MSQEYAKGNGPASPVKKAAGPLSRQPYRPAWEGSGVVELLGMAANLSNILRANKDQIQRAALDGIRETVATKVVNCVEGVKTSLPESGVRLLELMVQTLSSIDPNAGVEACSYKLSVRMR